MAMPLGHQSEEQRLRPLQRREKLLARGIGGVTAIALVVVLILSLTHGDRRSAHGCIAVSLAYSMGGTQTYTCGAKAPVPAAKPAWPSTRSPVHKMGAVTDAAAFRAQFPVLAEKSYLNAGTEGPLPAAAAQAVGERLAAETAHGRSGMDYIGTVKELAERVRASYAGLLGADPSDVALTGSTTDGCNTVLSGLDLRPGDQIITSDEEHPGLTAPLGRLRRHGIEVVVVPFARIAEAVTSKTRLVACSHVSWVNGQVVDTEALTASGVPFLLDAAQGIGAVPVDVASLGCAFYAASGQKWLCGPEGSGSLFVRRDMLDELTVPWPGYSSIAPKTDPFDFEPAPDAGRLDHGFPPGVRSTWALASLEVFERAGWDWVHDRAASLAASLAEQLADRGLTVAPRGRSTLVSWSAEDPEAEVSRLAAESVVVRSIPSHGGLVRASPGAWSSEEEIARLAELAATPH
jgi:selenocysteine lyase/cysteine desulfurase